MVPASSEIQTLDDLLAQFKEDPNRCRGAAARRWHRPHAGRPDRQSGRGRCVGINYVPFSGGGEALASILGGHVTAGVSGYQEFAGQIETGDLRPLAISSAERLEGIDIPTLKEQGVDVELTNWRAVFAPPGISDEDKQAWPTPSRRWSKSGWQNTLKERLAGPLSAAGRVRAVPRGGSGAGRDRAQGHRPRAVAGAANSGDDHGPRLRLGEAVLAVFVLGLGLFVAVERRCCAPGQAMPRSAPSCSRGWSRPGCCWSGRRCCTRRGPARSRTRPASISTCRALMVARARPADDPDEAAGFVIASTVLFVAVARALGSRRLVLDVAVGFVLCLAAYVAFKMGLGLILPAGVLAPAARPARRRAPRDVQDGDARRSRPRLRRRPDTRSICSGRWSGSRSARRSACCPGSVRR